MINKDPLTVAIADFCLAKVLDNCNSTLTQGIGTESYSAPEILDKDEPLSKSTAGDIYSLGVIAFELATGILLPKATDEADVISVFNEYKERIKNDYLVHLLKKCLKWRPDERIKKCNLLGHLYFLPCIQFSVSVTSFQNNLKMA